MARILVIDDHDLVRQSLKSVVERGGHEVVVAAEGRDGLKSFQAGNFDLVITDVLMPEVDGLEVVQGVRRLSSTVPIIVMSGGHTTRYSAGRAVGPDYLKMARAFGATKVLNKPFSHRQLLSLIAECLA
jgi:CheY-like chemotaxis protein